MEYINPSAEEQLKLIKENPDVILCIVLPTKQACMDALCEKPELIDFMSEDVVSFYELDEFTEHVKAVKQDGRKLLFVPKNLRTEELCKLAVQQDGWALEYVPKKMRTEELCRIAVKKSGQALYQVPEKLRTEEICKIAVQQDRNAMLYVPDKIKSKLQNDNALSK